MTDDYDYYYDYYDYDYDYQYDYSVSNAMTRHGMRNLFTTLPEVSPELFLILKINRHKKSS